MANLTWEVGDIIKWSGDGSYASDPLTEADIDAETGKASFRFPAELTAVSRTGWFYSAKNNNRNNLGEVDFTHQQVDGNIYNQAEAVVS